MTELLMKLRQWFCKHVFIGVDMQNRDNEGMVTWPCAKCGKVHRVSYGIAVPGKIIGPWFKELQ